MNTIYVNTNWRKHEGAQVWSLLHLQVSPLLISQSASASHPHAPNPDTSISSDSSAMPIRSLTLSPEASRASASKRQARERAELLHGCQRCGVEELRDKLGRPSLRSDAVQRDCSLEDQLIALLCEWLSIKQLPIADRIREQHFHRVITPMV